MVWQKLFFLPGNKRWERHNDVPLDRWNTILAFARHVLPRVSVSWPCLGPAELADSIKHKKAKTAAGLDGVSLLDLKSVPRPALQLFCRCHIFTEAEQTGQWPSQLVDGKVACIAKTSEPTDVMEYRPTTIFGLLYRGRGSFHARAAIRCLDPILPAALYGNRPACWAGQVWCEALWAIEHAYSEEILLCGLIAGLQKAFSQGCDHGSLCIGRAPHSCYCSLGWSAVSYG